MTYFDEVGVKHALVPGIYVYRKQPEVYFALRRRAQASLAVLRREWPQRAAAFRERDAELTSPGFWRRYLRMEEREPSMARPGAAASGQEAPLFSALAGV